ncbi:hypothetical protein DPMN_046437 [Dreissena polymorpha]|uniref:Uncharacterized protein n=1 Tax=Dreissena polymorpha TaxID=45954 RepID=A0A9D4HY65_DREPO|nr:hypothetical protein DPMN_046437 [Dreissena polymorpha]
MLQSCQPLFIVRWQWSRLKRNGNSGITKVEEIRGGPECSGSETSKGWPYRGTPGQWYSVRSKH